MRRGLAFVVIALASTTLPSGLGVAEDVATRT